MKVTIQALQFTITITIILLIAGNSQAQTTKTVGTGGDYATLNAAFADVGNGTLTGDIVFEVNSDITETAPTYISESGRGSWSYTSIIVQPSGSNRTVTADFTSPIFNINGNGSNITFDGRVGGTGSDNQLTITNVLGSAFFIYSTSNVENITIKYCNISGNDNETFRLYAENGTITNTVIDNCNIGNGSSTVTNGIRSHLTGTGSITTTLSNCNIFNFWKNNESSKGIYLESGNEGWTISNNSFYQTVARTAYAANTHYGIYIDGGDEHTITNNYIGGAETQCGGTAWTINGDYANKFVGIYLNVGSTTPASVNGNVISNFNHTFYSHESVTTLPGVWCGIYLNSGNANIGSVTGNIIGTKTGNNDIIVNTESDPEAANPANAVTYGIGINSTGSTVNVSNNHISGFTLNTSRTTVGHSFTGIQNSAATDITIDNNTIGSTSTANSIVSTNPNESAYNEQNVRGIENTANATITISNNTIANLVNSCVAKGHVVGIYSNNGVNNIYENTISQLNSSSGYVGSSYRSLMGISITSGLDGQIVSKNSIHSLLNSFQEEENYERIFASGILSTGGSSTISQNQIFDISFAKPYCKGFGIVSYTSGASIINNAIRLGNGCQESISLAGIYSSGGNKILGNSVYIGGTSYDYEMLSTFALEANVNDEVNNNNLVNIREAENYDPTLTGHFAIGMQSGTTLNCDYNNIYTNNPNAVASIIVDETYAPSSSLSQWQTATGGDANSLSIDPQFIGAEDLVPNLHISASSPMINMGTSVYPLVVDIDDDIRDQQPDIGCDEFYTGSVVVGEGQTYTTLKQAFDAINDGAITGNISINIQSSTTETATATLYQSGYNGTSDYTGVSIGTVTENITISGNIAAPIVSFNGAHDVNMVDLTIENENSGGYCIQLTNSASNNSIVGCSLVADTQLSDKGLITFDVAGSGTGNSNNIIESCTFGNGTSNYRYGVVSAGTVSVGNNDNTITESKFSNFWSNANSSAGIYLDANNTNWNITNNHLYQTETITATGGNEHFGILSLSSKNINISNNYIGGTSEECGGTAWTVSGSFANSFTGISVSGENTDESTVSGNTIGSFSWTAAPEANMYEGTGVWTAIAYGGGILTIADNTIGASTGTDNIVVETTSNYHVASYGIKGGIDGANVTISGNAIGSIDVSTNSVDYSHIFAGIQNDGATEITISANLIGSESTAKSINASTECTHTATGQHVAGIVNNANTASCTIEDNTVKNLYNSTVSSWSSDGGSPFGHMTLGIAATDGVNTITSNTIQNLSTSSIDNRNESVRGISLLSDKQGQEISNNTISGLSTTNNMDNSTLIGIWYDGPLEGTNLICSNKIYNFLSAEYTGLASELFGIFIYRDGIATTIQNNVISLGTTETAGHCITGIYTQKNGTFYHNSVNIDGDVSGSLDANTYAFRINLDISTAVVKNNIFVNTRTNSGSGKNYAALCQGTIELDNNAYWVDGTGTMLGSDGIVDKTELPIVAEQDENSVNAEVTFTSPNNADLSTTTAAVNAAADASVGVTIDYEDKTRNPLYPDMGAYEFTQPIIIDPGASLDFGWSDVLTPTAPQSYQIVGIDLSNNMVVTAPEHFQVSLSSDEGFAQSISVPHSNSNVDATIYARFLPNEEGSHFGDITNSASGQEVTVNVQGSARAIEPNVETGLVSDITTETATANADVTHTGGKAITTRGVIYWAYDGVDKEIGDAGVLNEEETGSFGAEEYSLPIAGLDINTHYNYRAHASNGETGYGETAEFWTLASIPNAPEVTNITTSTLDVTFEDNTNPEITEFAIHETTTNRYIQPDGSMNTAVAWQTKSEWGIAAVTLYDVNNRTGNRNYNFEIKARNGAGIETTNGDATSILTLANTPNPTHLSTPTETTINISVYSNANDYSNNTANTLYAIKENNLNQYVQTDGTLGEVIEWDTRENWELTLTGLSPATEYSFSTIAKNDNGIETDYSTPATLYTNAAIPNAPVVTILDEAQLEVEIAADDNPTDVEYSINVVINDNNFWLYITTDGTTLGSNPEWQTKAQWEQTNITAIAPNTAFYLTTKARNGEGTVTDASAQVDGTTTAEAPPAPYLYLPGSGVDKFTLWAVYLGSNPSNTELAIQDVLSGKFIQPDGTFADTPAWQNKASWDQTEVQANVASQYSIRVKARNANDIETAFGEPSEVWTNPYAPGVTLTNITSNSIDAVIDTKGNPSAVEYAIKSLNDNKWVQADGTLGDESFWQTIADWGNITITGLSPDTEYRVVAYARANVEQSVYNSQEQKNARTQANTPGEPSFSEVSQNSLNISIDANGNPVSVRYAIYESSISKYVGNNGNLYNDPIWHSIEFSNSVSVNNLSQITQYRFKVKARNTDDTETDFGPEANITTLNGPPIAPTLISPANESTVTPQNILFEWNEISNAENYTIQISTTIHFSEILFEEQEITNTSIQVNSLPYSTRIYWRVTAVNLHGTGESETANLWTTTDLPAAPRVDQITSSTVNIAHTEDNNPDYTEYAIHETTTNRYIQPNGSMNTAQAWQTKGEWGTTAVTLYDTQNRTGNRSYSFVTKARNGAYVETDYSNATNILTLANTPNPTYLHSPTETTINISVYSYSSDYSNNTANTLYAIKENNLNQYVQTDGTLGDVIEWNTRDSWAVTLTGLSPATEYSFSTIAKNDDGIETDYSTSATLYTNAAIPNAPLVTILDDAQLEVAIAADDNPTGVEYCINVVINGNNFYITTDGTTLGSNPEWQTKAQWDQTIVTAIDPNTAFYLTVKARNGAGTVTDASAQVDGTTTAQAPPAPQVINNSGHTETFYIWQVHLGNNPSNTELAIQDEISSRFVQPDGTLADTPAWQTNTYWNETYVQAEAATQYSIRAKARNANDTETAFGEPSEVWTNPYAPGVTLTNKTNNSIDAVIDAKGNPSAVEYAIKSLNGNKWVQADGTLGDETSWQTIEDWGNITITGLSPDTEYGVVAYARANAEQSVYNIDEQANARTHANIPGAPTFSDVSQNSLKITVNGNNNPTTVLYAVYETTTEMYVGANGSWTTTPYWYNIQYMTSIPVDGLLPTTQYTFKVMARNSDEVETDFGPEASVTTIDGPPIAPTLLSPADGAQDQTNTILFEWEEISNAESYSIQISRYNYITDLLYEEDGIGNSSIEVSNLPNGTTLYWRVSAANQNGTSEWSTFWSFTTEPGPPEPPTLLSPVDGETDLEPAKPFSFQWSIPEHTEGFTIEISTEHDFSSFELDSAYSIASWSEPHYFYFDSILHNTTYYWRVKTWNEHGDSKWSNEWTFTTMNVLPDVPTLTTPSNGLTDKETHNANFEWEPANHAEWYELQVATDTNFEMLIVDEKEHPNFFYILYNLEENTTYYWKVRSANQWAVSNWSDTWNFTTVGVTGVPTISESDVTVYPNPAINLIHIKGVSGNYKVEVISALGLKLIDKEISNNKLNIRDLARGVYILRIETTQGMVVKRILKQ